MSDHDQLRAFMSTAAIQITESPIESMFAVAAFGIAHTLNRVHRLTNPSDDDPRSKFEVFTQFEIDKFRVDFLIRDNRSHRLGVVVECDGHEFHKKLIQQVDRDKSRDRQLSELGFLVHRYSGSEIFRDPFYCALTSLMAAAKKDEPKIVDPDLPKRLRGFGGRVG